MGDMKRKRETGKETETEVSGINLDRTIREGLCESYFLSYQNINSRRHICTHNIHHLAVLLKSD